MRTSGRVVDVPAPGVSEPVSDWTVGRCFTVVVFRESVFFFVFDFFPGAGCRFVLVF